MILPVKLDKGATKPTRANPLDAGLDLYAVEEGTVPPRGTAHFDTGVHMSIPFGYCGMLFSRSGLYRNFGVSSTGLVDAGYTGSIGVTLVNNSDTPYTVHKGDRISQIAVVPCVTAGVVIVDEIDGGERGSKGFGSSGR